MFGIIEFDCLIFAAVRSKCSCKKIISPTGFRSDSSNMMIKQMNTCFAYAMCLRLMRALCVIIEGIV